MQQYLRSNIILQRHLKLLKLLNRNVCLNRSVRQNESKSDKTNLVESTNYSSNTSNLSLGVKVKETSKTIWYSGIVIGGIGVTAIILFTILKELFSNQSPQSIYSSALKECSQNPRICDLLGEQIKGFGEENSRGRRKHIRHTSYLKDGVEHLQMQFYIKGSRNQATVYLEMKKVNDLFEYVYLMAETEKYPKQQVLVIDNRNSTQFNSNSDE